MKARLFSLMSFIALGSISCDDVEDKRSYSSKDLNSIILDVQTLRYSDLPSSVKERASNAYTFVPVGNPIDEILKEKGYYLRMVINNELLAKVSTDNGLWKRDYLLDLNDLNSLYGKYKNHPELYDSSSTLVPKTRKFEGYDLVKVIREGITDTTYWGPLSRKPHTIKLFCSDIESSEVPTGTINDFRR